MGWVWGVVVGAFIGGPVGFAFAALLIASRDQDWTESSRDLANREA